MGTNPECRPSREGLCKEYNRTSTCLLRPRERSLESFYEGWLFSPLSIYFCTLACGHVFALVGGITHERSCHGQHSGRQVE